MGRPMARFLPIWALLAVVLLLTIWLPPHRRANNPPPTTPLVIVTLSSTRERARNGLPLTLASLVGQDHPVRRIWVFAPIEDRPAFEQDNAPLAQVLKRTAPTVELRFVQDRGPATKFLYAIERLQAVERAGVEPPLLVVLDDDHVYARTLVSTLVAHALQYPEAAVGMRGWRVRKDLRWGVGGDEFFLHVILGWEILRPYRVGVLTAGEGYLVRVPLLRGANLSQAYEAAPDGRVMDDIFMNGHLARLEVPRWVVLNALPNVILPDASSTLEGRLQARGVPGRAPANDAMLRFFGAHWEPNLWYCPGGCNGPRRKGSLRKAMVSLREACVRVWLALGVRPLGICWLGT